MIESNLNFLGEKEQKKKTKENELFNKIELLNLKKKKLN